jgi:two-component system response regulator FixJ
MNKTVHVIDDDAPLLDSISMLLEASDLQPRLYRSADAFLAEKPESLEGCIVSDVCMPGMSGMDLMLRLGRSNRDIPVILITGHGDIRLAVEAMKAGAFDFIPKPFAPEALVDSILQALRGTRRSASDLNQKSPDALQHLTRREVDVLKGLALGKQSKVIAHELSISSRTVEAYRSKLLIKLNARSTTDLVRMAIKAGLDQDRAQAPA